MHAKHSARSKRCMAGCFQSQSATALGNAVLHTQSLRSPAQSIAHPESSSVHTVLVVGLSRARNRSRRINGNGSAESGCADARELHAGTAVLSAQFDPSALVPETISHSLAQTLSRNEQDGALKQRKRGWLDCFWGSGGQRNKGTSEAPASIEGLPVAGIAPAPASAEDAEAKEQEETPAMNFLNMFGGSKDGQSSANQNSNGSQAGSGVRQDQRVSFGYSLMRGKRAGMEDFYHAQFKKHPQTGEEIGCFGVFDGHGGPNAADFVRMNLFDCLFKNENFLSDMSTALVESFVDTDQRYLQADVGANRDDGCTAVTAVLHGQRLVVANVGDSRAVLARKGEGIALSEDHKPNRVDERQRIESAGGVVVWAGTWRVGGVLAVSRAFGDRLLKRYVVAMPDITDRELESQDEALILASDGLWDVISNQDAAALIRDCKDAEKAARKLTDEAYCRGSGDNISCIVVRFKF